MSGFEDALEEQLAQLRSHVLQAHLAATDRLWANNFSRATSEDIALSDEIPKEYDEDFEAPPVRFESCKTDITIVSARPAAVERWGRLTRRLLDPTMHEHLALHNEWVAASAVDKPSRWIQIHWSEHEEGGRLMSRDTTGWEWLILDPTSNIRLVMSILGLLAITWDLVFIPMQAFESLPQFFADMLNVATFMVFAYWVLDFFLQFISAPEPSPGNQEVVKLYQLALGYIKGWMFMDLSLLGLDIGLFTAEAYIEATATTGLNSVRLIRVLRLLRFFRLLRLSRVQKSLMSILTRFTSVYFWMFIQMMKGIIIILVINHYVSIGWLVLGVYYTDPGQTWVAQSELLSASFAEQYVSSFHWSLAQFLPSTTNIAPVHGLERLYAVLAVLLAFGVLSSFITGVTNTVNALRAVRVSSLTQEAKLRQFFVERRLPARLLKLCLSAYHEKAEKASMSEQDVAILQSSPERLRAQLHQEMFRGVLTNRCWVRVALRDESTGLLMKICHLAMVERATMKSEDVFLEGTDCFGAVILTHGCMTYSTDHIKVARTSSTSLRGKPPTPLMFEEVSEGQWLCEIALWVHWWHRGQLSAQGVALYAFVDGLKLARLATETGGFVYTYLRTFGILLTSFMEEMMFNFQGTDLSIEEEAMIALSDRALHFQQLSRVTAAMTTGFEGNEVLDPPRGSFGSL